MAGKLLPERRWSNGTERMDLDSSYQAWYYLKSDGSYAYSTWQGKLLFEIRW